MSNVSLINGHIDGKQTNYEHIRSMSVKELTEFLFYHHRCSKCAFYKEFDVTCDGECLEGIKQYLESEVDTE